MRRKGYLTTSVDSLRKMLQRVAGNGASSSQQFVPSSDIPVFAASSKAFYHPALCDNWQKCRGKAKWQQLVISTEMVWDTRWNQNDPSFLYRSSEGGFTHYVSIPEYVLTCGMIGSNLRTAASHMALLGSLYNHKNTRQCAYRHVPGTIRLVSVNRKYVAWSLHQHPKLFTIDGSFAFYANVTKVYYEKWMP